MIGVDCERKRGMCWGRICLLNGWGIVWGGTGTAQVPLPGASAKKEDVPAVVPAIRESARMPIPHRGIRPLPLAGHWNLGEGKGGYDPAYQLELIRRGHHLLPWFLMPNAYAQPQDPRWIGYYQEALRQMAAWQLPISLVSTQWDSILSWEDKYWNLPLEENPNVVTVSGERRRAVSPFGPVDPWRSAGEWWGSGAMMKQLQTWYPDPPLVLFVSNHEHARLDWTKVGEDRRYLANDGSLRQPDSIRRWVGDQWIERYRALQQGITEGLISPSWRERARYVGYDAFGPAHFARWPGWVEYSLSSTRRFSPWPFAWDGASPSYYLFNWSGITDFTVYSPQIESMNWVFMLEETYRQNPSFWFELSTWDGYEPGMANDKRKFYQQAGQSFTPDRYRGMIQFGMWLLRPRVVREFRGYLQTVAETGDYFAAVLSAVDRVHHHPELRKFWETSDLVVNRAGTHPYQVDVPLEYLLRQRWFLLSTTVHPPEPWQLDTVLPVYTLARTRGWQGNREWLLYAHAPMGPRKGVGIELPGFGTVRVDVPVEGTFILVHEQGRTQQVLDTR